MRYGPWTALVAVSVMLFMSMALPLYGASVVNTYMVVDLGWNRESLGLMVGVNLFVVALSSPLAAFCIRRFGVSRTMAGGLIFMIVGAVVLAVGVSRPWQAILAYGVGFGITGSLTGVIPCQAAIASWFVRRRTMALSILYAVMSLGGFAAASLANLVITASGDWQTGWWAFAVVGIVGLPVALFLVRENKGEPDPAEGGPAAGLPGAAEGAGGMREAFRSPLLWATYSAMFGMACVSAFMVSHLQVYVRDTGLSGAAAASVISYFSAATVAGNLGFTLVAQRIETRHALMVALLPLTVAFALLANLQGFGLLAATAILLGVGFGACQVGAMAVMGHYWSTAAFPALTAVGLIIQTVSSGSLPIIAGRYFDAYGDYRPVIYGVAALNLAAAVALALMKPASSRSARPAPST